MRVANRLHSQALSRKSIPEMHIVQKTSLCGCPCLPSFPKYVPNLCILETRVLPCKNGFVDLVSFPDPQKGGSGKQTGVESLGPEGSTSDGRFQQLLTLCSVHFHIEASNLSTWCSLLSTMKRSVAACEDGSRAVCVSNKHTSEC